MLKTLLRIRLASLSSYFTGISRAKKKASTGKTVGFILLSVYIFGVFGFLFYTSFHAMGNAYHTLGLDWLYFAMFALSDFALMFVFSIFTAKAHLFEARDNELLLSMPVPPRYILTSRLLLLIGINLIFEACVAIPAAICGYFSNPLGIFAFVVLCLAIPPFSTALSSLMGWIIAKINVHVRHKSLVTVLLSLLFLGAYFYVYYAFFYQGLTDILLNGQLIADHLSAVTLLFWLGSAMANGNLLYLLLCTVILVVPFLVVCWILSVTFIRTATERSHAAKIRYEEKTLHVSSASGALVDKEFRHLASLSIYMLNAGLGLLFLLVGCVALLLEKGKILSLFSLQPDMADLLFPGLVVCILLMHSTVTFTAPSISLEGQSLWICQSLPLDGFQVLWAKIKMQLTLQLPLSLLASICVIVTMRPGVVEAVLALILPAAFAVMMAEIGIICNLKHPNFTWMSETQVVKQGVSLLLSMLIGFVLLLLLGGICILSALKGFALAGLLLATILSAVGSICLYQWLRKRGSALYAALS